VWRGLLPAALLSAALLALIAGCQGGGGRAPSASAAGQETSDQPAAKAAAGAAGASEATEADSLGLPYVYTRWEQFTTKDGLPNDHIFAIKAYGDKVWVGTEDGLACFDKPTRTWRSWKEADGLPWRVVTAVEVDPRTGDVWLGLFGGGLARFSGGRFDHFHQLNSGLVNDVVYGLCIEGENIWAATTAGASRYNTVTGEWTTFTEKNSPMEEIWNYGCCAGDGKVFLAVWGSGVLEYDVATGQWKDYLDPDGEMEIDLYRDDGIVHVITTGVSYVEKTMWVSTYFGDSRYDGRHWRGYYKHETGLPSDFANNVKARSANECWFSTDKGPGVLMDFPSDTWVTYTTDHASNTGKAVIQRGTKVVKEIPLRPTICHPFTIYIEFDGPDVWVGSSKGLAHAIGEGYYAGLRPPSAASPDPAGPPLGAAGSRGRRSRAARRVPLPRSQTAKEVTQ